MTSGIPAVKGWWALWRFSYLQVRWWSWSTQAHRVHLRSFSGGIVCRVGAAGNELVQGRAGSSSHNTIGYRGGLVANGVHQTAIIRQQARRTGVAHFVQLSQGLAELPACCQAFVHLPVSMDWRQKKYIHQGQPQDEGPNDFRPCYSKPHSLLQLVLRVGKRTASASGTATFLLHIPAHICLILAVLWGLRIGKKGWTRWSAADPKRSENNNCPAGGPLTCCCSVPFLLWFWMKSTKPWTTVFTATRPFSSWSQVGGGASGKRQQRKRRVNKPCQIPLLVNSKHLRSVSKM